MEIRIIAFGRIAEITGKELMLTASDTDTLKQQLAGKFPQLSGMKYAIAINKKMTEGNTELNTNDTVALMPPYSGG